MSEEGNSQNKGASNNQSREENKEEESPREENKENEEENKDNEEENKDNEEENKDNEEENKEEGEGEEEKKKEEPEGEPFSYLKKTKEVIWIKKKDEDKHFTTYKGTFKYSICILMENNDPLNSRFLKQTLRCIGNNLSKLNKDINIQAQEIGIFIFINEIGYENNLLDLNNLEIDNEEKNSEYILQEWMMDVENEEVKDLSNIKIFTINRLKYLYPVKSLKFYYNAILRQIKIKKK